MQHKNTSEAFISLLRLFLLFLCTSWCTNSVTQNLAVEIQTWNEWPPSPLSSAPYFPQAFLYGYLIMGSSYSTPPIQSVSVTKNTANHCKDLYLLLENVNVIISLVYKINWGRQGKRQTSLSCCLAGYIINAKIPCLMLPCHEKRQKIRILGGLFVVFSPSYQE